MDGNKLFIASQSCTHSMQWASRELATPLVQLISIFYVQLASWLLCMMLSLVAAIFLWMWCDNFPSSISFNLKGQLTNKRKNSFCLTLCNVQLNQLHTHWFIAKVKAYFMKTRKKLFGTNFCTFQNWRHPSIKNKPFSCDTSSTSLNHHLISIPDLPLILTFVCW